MRLRAHAKGPGGSALDALIYVFSAYGVPVAIAVMTLIALASWEHQYPFSAPAALQIRVVEDREGRFEPAHALAQLAQSRPVAYRDTRLSEAPFWLSFLLVPGGTEPVSVELPSRHAAEVACWEVDRLASLGHASRSEASGRVQAVKAGFALEVGVVEKPLAVLCRTRYSGPARISALAWPASELRHSVHLFHRNSGWLDGGLIMLAAFVLVTAIINREALYVLFAAWLFASLRLGAISAGWDTHWLGREVPADWLLPARQLTIAAYVLLTYALFRRLFREDLERVGHAWALRVAQGSCVVLLAAALFLPFARFLPVMWLAVAVGISMLAILLTRILVATRSSVAMWYSASLAMVLFAGLYEVLAAALGAKEFIGAINHVTAALASSLLAALAMAEQMRLERLGRVRAQAELRGTYEAIPIGLFTLDRDGAFVRGNPALTRMLGVNPVSGGKRHWREYFQPQAWGRLLDAVRGGAAHEIEIRGAGEGGAPPKWFLVKASSTDGRIDGSLQDITERHQATEQLRFLAKHDSLTGVLNRLGVEEVLEAATRDLNGERSLALAYLDLDRFKLINDLFGHIAGDDVLRQVCRRIGEVVGEGDAVGRIGGDEFVIAFPRTPIRGAAAVCRGIIDALGAAPYYTGDMAFMVKSSIGLVEVCAGTAVKDAIAMADRACRAAKAGSDGLVVYERNAPAFKSREQELRLIQPLGAGVAPEGLFLVMQPLMSLCAPYASLDFEILIRMRNADDSVIPGGEIIAAAESNGRVAIIDRWVLASTLAWLDRHDAQLGRTRFASINLSGGSLNDEKFIQDAFSMLASHPRSVNRLCIEVTEGVALHDLRNTKRFIDRVRGFGAKVALDDFGAGYTSFSYLSELPADALKIDGKFITGAAANPANLAIVEAIAELSRNLGMKTIAEWVDDRATLERLAQIGIDYVQGNMVGRPQDAEKILRAQSAASFIEDADLARYVRESLAGPRLDLWEPPDGGRLGLH